MSDCRGCTNRAALDELHCFDRLAMIDATAERDRLDSEMRAVLIQLATVSHVPAANPTPSRGSDGALGGNRPPGDLGEALYFRLYGPPFHDPTPKYPGARNNRDRAALIREANEELTHLRGHGNATRAKPSGETLEQRHRRIVRDGEGWSVRDAAVHFRCGEREIRSVRRAAGRTAETGEQSGQQQPAAERLRDAGRFAAGAATDARRARLLDLVERRSYSLADAARIVGISRSTAERYLGKRAA